MAILAKDSRFVFLLAPGTGSTVVAEALVNAELGRWFPLDDMRMGDGQGEDAFVPVKHTHYGHFRRWLLLERPLEHYQFVTTVRNPFDFWVSEYLRHRNRWADGLDDPNSHVHLTALGVDMVAKSRELEFADWLAYRWSKFSRKHQQLLHPLFTENADHVLRFERLEASLTDWLQSLGITETVSLPVINVTKRDSDYRSYYDASSRQLVERIFAPYLERFGYAF
ncbi:MAG: sulfotransferase family 2 domain-containing protein [Pseudomonadota bacterium]